MTFKSDHFVRNCLVLFGLVVFSLILALLATRVEFDQFNPSHRTKLVAYFPFTFTESVDPRSIFTVGQQVVAEHTFAFTARRSIAQGMQDGSVRTQIDNLKNVFRIEISEDLKTADGSQFNDQDLCASLKSSLAGTTHAPYSHLIKKVDCHAGGLSIEYLSIPVNLRYLLTLPDFALFRVAALPLSTATANSITGPYKPVEMTPEKIALKRNHFFSERLVSNKIETAELVSYSASATRKLIEKLDKAVDAAAYFFGYAVEQSDVENLRKKGFQVEITPHEWLLYLKVSRSVPEVVRHALEEIASHWRIQIGVAAYGESTESLSQLTDGPQRTSPISTYNQSSLNGQTLYTLESWAATPVFSRIINDLKKRAPKLKVVTLPRAQIGDLTSGKTKISLNLLGLSPVDKLSHFAFLSSALEDFSKVIPQEEIESASILSNYSAYQKKLIEFDNRILKSGIVIPIAHFPGIVAIADDLKVDRNTAFDWGIQLWSLQEK